MSSSAPVPYEWGSHPVHIPPLSTEELSSNSTVYEVVVASPSDEQRVLMWGLWSGIAFLALTVVLTAFFGILSNAKVRRMPVRQSH